MSKDAKAREKIKQKSWREGVKATILNSVVMEETCVWWEQENKSCSYQKNEHS